MEKYKDKYQLEVDNNYDWFKKNKEKLLKENKDKIGYFALIKNKEIIGWYKNYQEVILEAIKKFNNEPYSIQQLNEEEIIHNLGFVGLNLKWGK